MRGSRVLAQLCCFILLAITAKPVLMLAQHGGKAEPLRIEFKAGGNSATVTGRIKDQEEAEYSLFAKKGQRLNVRLTSTPRKSSVFSLIAPENADLGMEFDANWSYSGVLPKTGDYLITIARPTSDRGSSNYRLAVTVR
jgi:hypothetical protein